MTIRYLLLSCTLVFFSCSTANNKVKNSSYDYSTDHFEREPFVAYFRADDIDFSVIGIHVKPDRVQQELNQIDNLYDEVVNKSMDEDAIIIGDLNAGCTYLSREQEASLDLRRDIRFKWVIDYDADTTVGRTHCAYDRIITAGSMSAKNFKIFRDIPPEVSDHYSIGASFISNKELINVGAFNIKWLGRKKIKKPIVINHIIELALRHHVLLLQEVRDTSGEVKAAIQTALPESYKVIQSKSLGRTNYKESYIYIYDTKKINLISYYEFPDGHSTAPVSTSTDFAPNLVGSNRCVYSAHPGCCRGHQGILRCEDNGKVCTNGFLMCRDGTTSKSCRCH